MKFFSISESIRKVLLDRFSCQMYFDNSVMFAYFSRRKLIVWFVNRSLNGVSVEPIYTLFVVALSSFTKCFVHNATSKALSIHGPLIWPTTVAVLYLIICMSCPTDSGIVALNDRTYVGHATVANHNCAPIEYFVPLGAFWEVLIYY